MIDCLNLLATENYPQGERNFNELYTLQEYICWNKSHVYIHPPGTLIILSQSLNELSYGVGDLSTADLPTLTGSLELIGA